MGRRGALRERRASRRGRASAPAYPFSAFPIPIRHLLAAPHLAAAADLSPAAADIGRTAILGQIRAIPHRQSPSAINNGQHRALNRANRPRNQFISQGARSPRLLATARQRLIRASRHDVPRSRQCVTFGIQAPEPSGRASCDSRPRLSPVTRQGISTGTPAAAHPPPDAPHLTARCWIQLSATRAPIGLKSSSIVCEWIASKISDASPPACRNIASAPAGCSSRKLVKS